MKKKDIKVGTTMKKVHFLVIILVIILQTACSAQPQPLPQADQPAVSQTPVEQVTSEEGYPVVQPEINSNSAYPEPVEQPKSEQQAVEIEGDHYVIPEESAFQALPIAMAEAKEWRPNAVLMQIPRLRQMESNLALPKGPSGWFFGFMDTNGSSVELYVEVIGQEVAGQNEVQQIYVTGEPPFKLLPIDTNKKILDHKDAYNIFMDNNGSDYLQGKGRVELDFQLVQLEGMENPVWSIFDVAYPDVSPLLNVDAGNGQLVDDPFGFLRE